MSSVIKSPDYNNPPLSKRKSTIFNYDNEFQQTPGHSEHFSQVSNQSIIQNYPTSAYHARHPVLIACQTCQRLTMT